MKKIFFLFISFSQFIVLTAQTTNNQNNPVYGNYPTHKAVDANTPDTYFLVDNPLGKMYFSNQPFTSSNTDDKRIFKSNEFIYGRLKLNSGTIKDVLKITPKNQNEPYPYFLYEITIYKNKKALSQPTVYAYKYCLLKDEDLNKDYLDFDILPNPSIASTPLINNTVIDNYSSVTSTPLYNAIRPEIFSEDGTYKIDVVLRNNGGKDAWGKDLPETSWPIFESDFNFEFKSTDISSLVKNEGTAREKLNNQLKNNAAESKSMPKEWFAKSSPVSGGLSEAAIKATYLSSFPGAKIIKFYAAPSGGWTVVKNDYGIPQLQYHTQLIMLFCKDAERCWQAEVVLKKDYLGSGKYGKVYLSYPTTIYQSDPNLLPCNKMK